MRPVLCLLAALSFTLPSAFAATPTEPREQPAVQKNLPVILVAVPIEAAGDGEKSRWFAGISEQLLQFRLSASDGIITLPPQKTHARAATMTARDYRAVAAGIGATHVIQQNYEISRDGKTVSCLFEVVPVSASERIQSFENTISLESLAGEIDKAVMWVFKSVGVTPGKDLNRFFSIPAIPVPHKELRKLGDIANAAMLGSKDQLLSAAQKSMEIADRDSRNLLAQYIAASAYARAGTHDKAATILKDILAVIPNHKALYIDICRSLRHEGRFSEVLRYASAAESQQIQSAELLLEGALAFEALGRTDKARRVFEAILDEDGRQTDALLFFAREHNRKGEYAEAVKLSKQIIAIDGQNGSAYQELGSALTLLGKKKMAVDALEKSVDLAPNEASSRRMLADLRAEAGEFEKAARHYAHIVNLNPKFYGAHIIAAETWEKAGSLKDALTILLRTERLFPDSMQLQKRIGLLEQALNNIPNAVLHLERYIKDGAPDVDVYYALGDIYTATGKHDRALYMYNHAMPLMKDKKPCRQSLAALYMKMNDPKSAISQLLEILKHDPAYPKVHRLLADAWYTVGTSTEALACYKKARELEGDDVLVQQRIADITFAAGNWEMAGQEYRRLVKLDEKNPTAFFRLAVVMLDQGMEPAAQQYLDKAKALGTADLETMLLIARGFDKVNNPRTAIVYYSACLAQDPRREDALLGRAAAHVKVAQKTAAAECYERIFALDNDRNQDYLARAGLLFEEENQITKAHELYKQFIAKGYRNPEINLHLARLEYGHHNYEKVIALLGKLDKKLLDAEETVKILGVSYYQTKRFAPALPYLETAAVNAAGDAALIQMLAESYESEGALDKARIAFARLAELVPDAQRKDCVFHIGELHEKEKLLDKAAIRYRDNIGEYPDDMRNYERLVAITLEQKNLSQTRDVLEKAVVRQDAAPSFLKTLAQVCADLNDTEAAFTRYTEYLKKVPDDFSAWCAVGDIYFAKEMYSNAAEAFGKAAAIKPTDFGAHNFLAKSLRKTGNIEKAIVAAGRAHAIQPNESEVVVFLADCYRTLQQTANLIPTLEKLAVLRPGDFDTRFELGTLLLAAQKIEQGVSVLEQACTMRPKNSEVHIILARSYEGMKNNDARFAHLKNALAARENDVEALYEMGRYQVEIDRDKKAVRYFAQALALNDRHTPTLYEYSRLLHEQGAIEQAFGYMETAVDLDRCVAKYQVLYSRLAWEMKKTDIAVAAVVAALSADPSSIDAMSHAGLLYMETGRSDQARQVLTKAISQDQNRADCFRYLGEIFFEESDYARAIGYFKRALDIAGYHERTAVCLGRAYKLGCQDEKSRMLFEQVLSQNPQQYEAYYHLTNLYLRSGRNQEARGMVESRKREQKTIWHHLANGEIQEIEGDTDAAQISYSVALRLMPDIPEAYSGLGRIDLMRRDCNSAIVNFGKALARDPYNPYLMLDMARAYEGIGETASAYEIYREVSSKYPQVSEAYYRFAQLKSSQKEHLRALEIVEEGLAHNPKNPRLLMGLGHAYRVLNRYDEAIAAYEDAVKRGGDPCIDAYVHIANIYSKALNNEDAARKYYRKYLKSGGEQEMIKRQIANIDYKE